jgi:hypothetical protein
VQLFVGRLCFSKIPFLSASPNQQQEAPSSMAIKRPSTSSAACLETYGTTACRRRL